MSLYVKDQKKYASSGLYKENAQQLLDSGRRDSWLE